MKIFIYTGLFLLGIGTGIVVKGEIQEDTQIKSIEVQPIEYMQKAPTGFQQQGGGSCGG